MSLLLTHPTPTLGLRIDPLAPGDTDSVETVFAGLSPRSRFLRFHTGVPRLTASMLRRLSDVSDGHHHAFVATIGDRPVGIVRWIRMGDDPATADLALEVVDDAQGQGVGKALLAVAAQSAHAADVVHFIAEVSGDNHTLRRWLTRHGRRAVAGDAGCFRLPVDLVARAA